MLTSKPKCFANAATTFGLATTVAALWIAGAAAAGPPGYPISAERAKALHECSGLADEWGYAYRDCMVQRGQQE
jgi:hypothetical protein